MNGRLDHQGRLDQKARSRAYAKLAKRYPRIFKTLVNMEREQLGLPPVGVLKPGVVPKVNPR